MSYHVQHNTQQRSLGIFIVLAFHVLLIWALANGLGSVITSVLTPDPIKIAQVKNPVMPPPPIDPIEPQVIKNKIIVSPDTPLINLESDAGPVIFDRDTIKPISPAASEISKPKLLKATKPDYPSAASRLGEEGATGLELYITAEGRVGDVKVYSPSGSPRLDEAAVKHAKRNWSFSACTEGGKAVACWFKTKLVWRLEDATH